ncbi:unnamed protein product [Cylicostephanus goldi]|uniref:DNA replication factor Dna2 N-terminal domain-containing protein n=1 Tax=Cylicostephanus goldi TaxID=71465 RepID=A0A3P7Q156_CYLGO|nr:unnamed protein product [Cylicostephanus goldi]
MLIGVIVHELFQAAIRCPSPAMVTSDWLLKQWRDCLYDEVLGELAALRLTPSQVETELMPYVDVVVNWVQSNIPGGSSYPSNNAAYQITKVHDIEENIWDPQLGIKGKIDVTLETKTNGKIQQRPLELKTGKSAPSSDHAAQSQGLIRDFVENVIRLLSALFIRLRWNPRADLPS